MSVAKRYWFPAAVAVLAGVIGFNLYTVSRRGGGTTVAAGTADGPASRPSPADAARAERPDAGPAQPRTLSLVVAPRESGSKLDRDALTRALLSIGAVQRVEPEGDNPLALRVTVVEPVKQSLLRDRLENHGAVVVEDRSPLRGDLRLHVSGMSCEGCANALRGKLASLNGVQVQRVELPSDKEGYAYVAVAEGAPLTLASLKEAVAKTPFSLDNVEWAVPREKTAGSP